MNKNEVLSKYFGYEKFRKGQEVLIDSALKHTDVLGVMPTGAGKSICFQVPALMLDGITIVISPLVSLMYDQVQSLVSNGVKAAFINSSLTEKQIDLVMERALNLAYKIIYVAPERLSSSKFLSLSSNLLISMVVVDEAHCISQWGNDFRPSYAVIPDFINKLKSRPIIGAYTATATQIVKDDICEKLCLEQPVIITTGFDRDNLYFSVYKDIDKKEFILKYLLEHPQESGIIYCNTRKNVDELTELLNSNNYNARNYHAGLSDNIRSVNQKLFVRDDVKIIVATNAFGMGIDKSNVSYVIHYNMPKDMESYYQEAGRAGRDGSNAQCILLYGANDYRTNKLMLTNNQETTPNEELYKLQLTKLDFMNKYCLSTYCLRKMILNYFGEACADNCDNCGNCNNELIEIDVTYEAKMIINCIFEFKARFGVKLVIDILKGKNIKKIREYDLDKTKSYGVLKDCKNLQQIVDTLISLGYLKKTLEQYPRLQANEEFTKKLKNGESIVVSIVNEISDSKTKVRRKDNIDLGCDPVLFEKLRVLRSQKAKELGYSAFIVFTNRTLIEMTNKLPITEEAFLAIDGVSRKKLESFGEEFMSAIKEYVLENNIDVSKIVIDDDKVVKEISISNEIEDVIVVKELQSIENIEECEQFREINSTINVELEHTSNDDERIPISKVANLINEHSEEAIKVKPNLINEWLVEIGYLIPVIYDGKVIRIPTELGRTKGITIDMRESLRGRYVTCFYNIDMVDYIVKNYKLK